MAELSGSGAAGSLNGATHVEVVPAPSTGFRMVRCMYFNHTDSSPVTLHIAKKAGGTPYQFHSQTMLRGYTLEFGDGDIIILGANESLEAWLDSSPSTQPTWVSTWGDK